MTEKNLEIGLLNDYYGGLLTEYQSRIVSMYYDEDLSLAEIADEVKVSRQAVRDVLVRSAHKLNEYEDKLGLVSTLSKIVEEIERIKLNADSETTQALEKLLKEVKEI